MKISNETKVGALTAIAITLLILGFNFLKGRSVFKTGNFLYAKYSDAKGIMVSNPVYANGYQIGSVYDIENEDENLKNIIVTIKLKSYYNIPANSVASINGNPLGSPSIEIALGNDTKFLQSGDSLKTINNAGLLNDVKAALLPVTEQLKHTMHSLDTVLLNINTIFDPNTKNNLQQVIANLNKTTVSLTASSVSIQSMLDKQSGSIAQSMNNVNSFTKNLADNNDKITHTLDNLQTTTNNLSKTDIQGSVAELKKSVQTLNTILDKVNTNNGSLGLLMNDRSLYNNLTNTVRSANILIDDLKTHPKRYVNISVFGKKDKSTPLTAPLNDSANKK
ncbi:MAG: mammalian cell entry protein [Chitinophaga sp.]|jgi:phospholipid/cholesterol/gamma-HCH transport system substrate-binding protein|nr:mammalian cell entry protein [Chitinophaga sp.]